MTIDDTIEVKPEESSFEAQCRKFGRDPNKISLFDLKCLERGLDPKKTSPFALECHD